MFCAGIKVDKFSRARKGNLRIDQGGHGEDEVGLSQSCRTTTGTRLLRNGITGRGSLRRRQIYKSASFLCNIHSRQQICLAPASRGTTARDVGVLVLRVSDSRRGRIEQPMWYTRSEEDSAEINSQMAKPAQSGMSWDEFILYIAIAGLVKYIIKYTSKSSIRAK